MKAALYARVSSERQAEKDLSIPAQLKALRKYALEREWDVVTEYVDEAESARTANRPAFREMIASAKKKERGFDVILVWKLSRFARNREDSILYKSLLRKRGISVISINEQVDESPAGHLLEGIIEVIDEFYSINLSQDTIRGMKENASRGFHNGGYTPFGYKKVKVMVGAVEKSRLAPEEGEAPVVRRVFRMAVEGSGGKEVAKALNADGLRTRTGKHFSATAINNILRNEVYTGALVWHTKNGGLGHAVAKTPSEVVRSPDSHPSLVSKEDLERVQRLLTERRPSVRHPRTVSSQYLLSGLLHCGRCGSAMIGCWAKSGKFFYYQCNNHYKKGKEACDAPMTSKGKLEGFVLDRIKENILTEDNLKRLADLVNEDLSKNSRLYEERLAQIEQQLGQVSNRLAKLYGALETGKVDLDDLAPRLKELRASQRELQEKRDELSDKRAAEACQIVDPKTISEYVADLKGLLASASFLEQKAFLRSFVKRVEFNPPQVAIDYTIPLPQPDGLTSTREVLRINKTGSPILTFPHPKVETFFEVAIAHAPQGGRSELWHNQPLSRK
ncbi:MAG: recombinase family protein [Chloroflexi bacterium]|nr:recombinase family protein [Chloroflexota bacterium]